MKYLPRIIDQLLADRLESSRAILLEGPKSCGKTFTAQRHAKSAIYLGGDLYAREALRTQPTLVLNGEAPQLIDEWQLEANYVWDTVRKIVDDRQLPGQFILTGSASPTKNNDRHSGAGRFARLKMRPMTLFESGESSGKVSIKNLLQGREVSAKASQLELRDVIELLVRGGWPGNLELTPKQSLHANKDYLQTLLEVELSEATGRVRDVKLPSRIAQALARRTSQELKIAKIASESAGESEQAARSTVYDYLGRFEQIMLFENLLPWFTHLRSRSTLRKAPRVHFVDPSLAIASLGANTDVLLRDLETTGFLFESMVVRDLRVYAQANDAEVFYFRDSSDLEVDIIVEASDGTWGALEVKLSPNSVEDAATKLKKFASVIDTKKKGEPAFLGVVTAFGYAYTRPDGIHVIPIESLGP